MNEKRENYLKELKEIRQSLGYEKMRDLDLMDAVMFEFDGELNLEEINKAMGLIYCCWYKDDIAKSFEQYAYGLNEFMSTKQKSFEELENMDTWDLLEKIYDYIG